MEELRFETRSLSKWSFVKALLGVPLFIYTGFIFVESGTKEDSMVVVVLGILAVIGALFYAVIAVHIAIRKKSDLVINSEAIMFDKKKFYFHDIQQIHSDEKPKFDMQWYPIKIVTAYGEEKLNILKYGMPDEDAVRLFDEIRTRWESKRCSG